jgi:hypothetical protein
MPCRARIRKQKGKYLLSRLHRIALYLHPSRINHATSDIPSPNVKEASRLIKLALGMTKLMGAFETNEDR